MSHLVQADPTISLCMIVKNEEEHLPGCLDSVLGLAHEIIVVDTGSTDRTVEIARSYGARVEHFRWIHDFAAARNYSLRFATCDWIFWMDADDRLEGGQHAAIRALLASGRYPVYGCLVRAYQDGLDEQWVLHTRFFRRDLGLRFEGAVHETLPVVERLGLSHIPTGDIRIRHIGYDVDKEALRRKNTRNLAILQPLYASAQSVQEKVTYLAYIFLADAGLEDWEATIAAGRRCLEMSRALGEGPNGWFANLRYTVWMYLVNAYAALGQVDAAMQVLQEAVAELGPVRHFFWRAGLSFYNAGRYDEAEALARYALELAGSAAERRYRYVPGAGEALLGTIAMRRGRNQEAYVWLGRGLAAPGTSLDARRLELDTILVADAVRHGVAPAIRAVGTATHQHPELEGLAAWAQEALRQLGGLDQMLLEPAGRLNGQRTAPEQVRLLERLAGQRLHAWLDNGLLRAGGGEVAAVVDLMADPAVQQRALAELSQAFAVAGLIEGALSLVGEVDAGCAAGWNYLGLGLALIGQRDEAYLVFRQAAKLDTGLVRARQNLQRLGNPSRPLAYPDSYLRRQTLHLCQERLWGRALPRARVLWTLYPGEVEAGKLLALALHQSGFSQEAARVLQALPG